jgi:peptidoglycan/LPS O-acetylase OafA/YrhL
LKNHKLFGLDHLRALAILFVFIFHYGRLFKHPQWTNSISKFGWTGVDLFFVLSGYLIAGQLFAQIAKNQPIVFKIFFIKRFFRIIPAYLFVLAIYYVWPDGREREALAPMWKYLTFTQNLGLDAGSQGTFSHAWSLCIEEQFYLLLPLLLIAIVQLKWFRFGYGLLIVFFVAGFAARLYAWHYWVTPFVEEEDYILYWYKWIYYPTYARLDGLLIGVSIAALFQFKQKLAERIQQHGNGLLLLGLFVLGAAYFLCMDEQSYGASIFGFPLVALGYGCIVAGAVSPTSFLFKWQSNITEKIATLSYAIYLSHKIVIHVTQETVGNLFIDKNSNAMFLLCAINCFVVAWLINKWIEKPFLRLRDKILQIKS